MVIPFPVTPLHCKDAMRGGSEDKEQGDTFGWSTKYSFPLFDRYHSERNSLDAKNNYG